MSSPRSRRCISEIIFGGKLFTLIQNGAWRHFVAMVTQIYLIQNFKIADSLKS